MDSNQFEVLVAAILVAGANAGKESGSVAAGASAYGMIYAIEKLREYNFTHGATVLPKP